MQVWLSHVALKFPKSSFLFELHYLVKYSVFDTLIQTALMFSNGVMVYIAITAQCLHIVIGCSNIAGVLAKKRGLFSVCSTTCVIVLSSKYYWCTGSLGHVHWLDVVNNKYGEVLCVDC